jgi:DNA (cytosine-5)-methyltransferase 1
LRSGLSRKDSAEAWLNAFSAVRDRRWYTSLERKCGEEVQALIASTVSRLACPPRGRGSAFIKGRFVPTHAPAWYRDERLAGICHHDTRGHLETDLHRYLFVSAFGQVHGRSPRLKDFPADLLPDHENAKRAAEFGGTFSDRFRVQLATKPSTTITSHIAKDGHYYIHPDPAQCRSLTLREAARLQTFPDNYFFCGPRTMGYGQVGNAVPPLLARSIAAALWAFLSKVGLDK